MSAGKGFITRSVHVGFEPESTTGALAPPVFQTSTYAQIAVNEPHGPYEYARTANPTREVLERQVAAMEGASHGIAYASGCGATNTVMHLMKAGDTLLSIDDVYGGTHRIFRAGFGDFGLRSVFADLTDLDAGEQALAEHKPAWLWIETPTNPLLKVADIEALCERAHAQGTKVLVDNTFASPYFQSPLALGADLVLHSTTKYLNGHADVVGGIVVTNDEELAERLRYLQNALGAVPGPWDCWLTARGARTLGLRMERHQQNAFAVANYLQEHADVSRVIYPGLASHPQHDIAKKQMRGFSGMVSFELEGGLARAKTFVEATRIFTLAESLGGIESLIELPALMTHAAIPAEQRAASGITDGLIRLSVGIEDQEDLLTDLEHAFAAK